MSEKNGSHFSTGGLLAKILGRQKKNRNTIKMWAYLCSSGSQTSKCTINAPRDPNAQRRSCPVTCSFNNHPTNLGVISQLLT